MKMKRDELKHLPFKKSIIYYNALNIRNIHVSYEANKIMTLLPPRLYLNITHPSIVFKAPMWFFYIPFLTPRSIILNYLFLILNVNVQDYNLLLKTCRARCVSKSFFFFQKDYISHILRIMNPPNRDSREFCSQTH